MEKNKRKGGALSSCHFSLQDLVEKHMQINSWECRGGLSEDLTQKKKKQIEESEGWSWQKQKENEGRPKGLREKELWEAKTQQGTKLTPF